MALTTFDIFYDIYLPLVSEVNVQQSGQIRPVSDMQYWLNSASQDMFHEWCSEYQKTQMYSDELSPFTLRKNVIVTQVPGQPFDRINISGVTDYQYLKQIRVVRNLLEETDVVLPDGTCLEYKDADFAALITKYKIANKFENDIQLINSARWSSRLKSITKKPTFQDPAATQDSQGFLLAPKGITSVVVEYFRSPRNCTFAYTIGTGDIIVYNQGGSVQLEWPKSVVNEFLTRLVKKYGLRTRDAQAFQAADINKKELQ